MNQWRHEQCRVANAPGDHHLGACRQCLGDAADAQVGVGREHGGTQVSDLAATFHQRVVAVAHPVQHIVADYGRDLQAGQTELAGNRCSATRGGQRVGRAHVGDDAYAATHASGQHGAHARFQQRVEAGFGVFLPGLLRQRNGALGQAFEDQVVDGAMLGQFKRRFDAVA